jgi:hypothetical protein
MPAQNPSLEARSSRWYRPGETFVVAGRAISCGLFYAGNHRVLDRWGHRSHSAWIDSSLEVEDPPPDYVGHDITNQAAYSILHPWARGLYLDWLQSGRKMVKVSPNLVHLFLDGIELWTLRQGDTATTEEFDEVIIQLRDLHTGYGKRTETIGTRILSLAEFLQVLQLVRAPLPEVLELKPVPDSSYYLPPLLALGLARCRAEDHPIPASWALAWLRSQYQFKPRSAEVRCPEEHAALFEAAYKGRFIEGIRIQGTSREPFALTLKTGQYGNSSASVRFADLKTAHLPLTKFIELDDMAKACSEELEPYARYVMNKPELRYSAVAIGLLPAQIDLQSGPPAWRQGAKALGEWLGKAPYKTNTYNSLRSAWPLLPVEPGRGREAESLSLAFARFGFGLEPDVRFFSPPLRSSGLITLFRLPDSKPIKPTKNYALASLIVHLGLAIAGEGQLRQGKNGTTIEKLIESIPKMLPEPLAESELLRLAAYADWVKAAPIVLTGLKPRIALLSPEQREKISKFLLAVMAESGYVSADRVKAMEKIFSLLTVAKESVFSKIHHAVTSPSSPRSVVTDRFGREAFARDPVSVQVGARLSGRKLPAPPPDRPVLNMELVEDRRRESIRAGQLLQEIFSSENAGLVALVDPAASNEESSKKGSGGRLGLNAATTAFLREILTQPRWSAPELESLAARHRIMVSGAVDQINEMALEEFGDPLLEGDDSIQLTDVREELLRKLADK